MKKNPFFSIIIPAYNAEKYINECILSLQAQTFNNFEIIIVDDGSKDRTATICDSLSEVFPNLFFKVIHQSNQRQIAARMNGVDHAVGEYCIFVDADDKLVPHALKEIKDLIDVYNADIVIYNGVRFWKDKSIPFWPHYKNTTTYLSGDLFDEFRKDALVTSRFNNVWNKAFKRSLIVESYRFNDVSFISNGEDYLMQIPWLDIAKNAVYLPANLYLYRANEESVTSVKFDVYKFKSALYMYRACKSYYKKWNIENGENICNNKFLDWVLGAIKQLFYKKDFFSYKEKKTYLYTIAENIEFRDVFKRTNVFTLSKKGIILLWLLYHKKIRLVLFIIENFHKK